MNKQFANLIDDTFSFSEEIINIKRKKKRFPQQYFLFEKNISTLIYFMEKSIIPRIDILYCIQCKR